MRTWESLCGCKKKLGERGEERREEVECGGSVAGKDGFFSDSSRPNSYRKEYMKE